MVRLSFVLCALVAAACSSGSDYPDGGDPNGGGGTGARGTSIVGAWGTSSTEVEEYREFRADRNTTRHVRSGNSTTCWEGTYTFAGEVLTVTDGTTVQNYRVTFLEDKMKLRDGDVSTIYTRMASVPAELRLTCAD